MMQQERGHPAEAGYRPGGLELVIALSSLALIIGIGIGAMLNQSMQSASASALEATAKPTRSPKAPPRAKPTAAAAAVSPRAKPTAQAAKPTSAPSAAEFAPTSAPPEPTPAATPAPPAADSTRHTYIEYTVKKGDLLYNLAIAHGVTVDQILSINSIKNPDSLVVGQVIHIPEK
jgi:LysM repeat protein